MIANLKRAACWINFYAKISRSIASLLHPQSGMGSVWSVGTTRAPVAQLDRASDFGSEGCRFKSCPVHHGFYWGFEGFLQFLRLRVSAVACTLLALCAPRDEAYLHFLGI